MMKNNMNGLIALLGSGEYLPIMDDVDRYLLANCGAGGRQPRVVCLPTAAGQEGDASVGRWSRMGVEHFIRLGAEVRALPVIDAESANVQAHASAVDEADIIYFSGGKPDHLYQSMKGSLVWNSVQKAMARGAVYAGCSAGAMILGRELPDFRMIGSRSKPAFDIVRARFVIPHFDAIPLFGKPLVAAFRSRLKEDEVIVGVDENTALIGKPDQEWLVMGAAQAHAFTRQESKSFSAGEKFKI